jgi:hypothetical protein
MSLDRRSAWTLAAVIGLAVAASQGWTSYQQRTLGQRLAALAAPGDIQMLSSVTCGICTRARVWFHQHEVPFSECFIERDASCAARFQATLAPGTPVMLVQGQVQVGFDPQRLLSAVKAH